MISWLRTVRFGTLRSLRPVSGQFGWDRGLPWRFTRPSCERLFLEFFAAKDLHLLRNGFRRVMRIPRSGALILLYHRVTELSSDPFCLANGGIPPRTAVLTFDDGSSDGSSDIARSFVSRYPDIFRILEHRPPEMGGQLPEATGTEGGPSLESCQDGTPAPSVPAPCAPPGPLGRVFA